MSAPTSELDQALLLAAERLARASAKLGARGDEYAKRTASIATGRLEVLRRLAAPGADDVVWVERVGRSTSPPYRAGCCRRDDRPRAARRAAR